MYSCLMKVLSPVRLRLGWLMPPPHIICACIDAHLSLSLSLTHTDPAAIEQLRQRLADLEAPSHPKLTFDALHTRFGEAQAGHTTTMDKHLSRL